MVSLETLTTCIRLENSLITLGKVNIWVIKTHHVCRAEGMDDLYKNWNTPTKYKQQQLEFD